MFIGREVELDKLNRLYRSDAFECCVVYGRRRVGKTTLIQEFCRDKRAIYFIAREASSPQNLASFSADALRVFDEGASALSFDNWDAAFDYIYRKSASERLILVIDEYPYLAEAERSISSLLQAKIDTMFKRSKLFLILCGSSMSFMENQVLGYESPLYGRRTAQFKIEHFDFFDSLKFHKGFSRYDSAAIYGITGGIPQYLQLIGENRTIRENIVENFLDKTSYLYEEPSNLLKQELREPAAYNAIIGAIAGGALRLNEIATKAGLESSKCGKYLISLISLGLVKKEKPVGEREGKRSIYQLDDNMFKFWYRFIPNNMSNIESGLAEYVYDRFIEPYLPAYMGGIFEQICLQYMKRVNAKFELPFVFRDVGRWWGNNPLKKRQEEIDMLATADDAAIFCECKWRDEPVSIGVVEALREKSELFSFKEKYYYLFSKTGFDEAARKIARRDEFVRLVDFADMTA